MAKNSLRNHIAKKLWCGSFTKKVVPSKKLYNRKKLTKRNYD
jgi:hypothetical protein